MSGPQGGAEPAAQDSGASCFLQGVIQTALREKHLLAHPDAEIYLSMPGIGEITGARVLAEFGDDPHPLQLRQGPHELRRHQPDHPGLWQEPPVQARYVRNNRLADALQRQASPPPRLPRRPPLLRQAACPRGRL